ncbi:Kinase, NEK [Giardia muris]|uniref:non-specific serine/threonine protein kinase n=1 Tax=Giardia muris TaxID=5742 RepID=A0A4Z1SR56_GIAMU|nr:Kinase, NEK [Giardia muris]|eukprot:TNJ28362.1 Kinase, NEK [Giardia muris]
MFPTELMKAAGRGDLERVKANLGDAGKKEKNGETALMKAAREGRSSCILPLEREIGMRSEGGWTALMFAAKEGHSDCISLLDGEIGMQNKYGCTALIWAARNGNADCARLLLSEAGRSTKERDSFPPGTTALMLAAHYNHPEIVQLLLPYEQGMKDSEDHTAKWYANNSSEKGGFTRVRQLLESEGTERLPPPDPELPRLQRRINELTTENDSLKKDLSSSKNAHEETKKELSQLSQEVSSLKQQLQKANEEAEKNHELNETLNKRAQEAERSLTEAREEVSSLKTQLSKTIEDLKKELADQKAQNLALENENTLLKNGSLIPAAIQGDLNTLRRRLDQAGQKDSSGMTALMHAASRGQTEVVRLLRPLEARLQDGRGWTALMHAVGGGHEECVGLLLLERDLKDGEGRTAAEHAVDEKMRRVLVHQPTLPRLPDSLSGYHLTAVLGEGSFGAVYTAHGNGQNVAVKVVSLGGRSDKERELLRREAKILPSLDHPNIIRCIRGEENDLDSTYVLVMDLCCGDLRDEMKERRRARCPYTDQEVWKTIREVAAALTYLHEKRHVHRDLKPANILVALDGRCVLGDFGFAKVLEDSSRMSTYVGTGLYMAPERHKEGEYDKSVDVWALGVVAYEMCTGRLPFRNVAAVLEKTPAPSLRNRPSDLAPLISRMLSRNPKDRPTARDVLEEAERHQ